VSGCHANPAITLALAIFRGFSWWKLAPYWAAQVFGAIVGAALVYVLYAPIIAHFEVLHHVTRGLDEGAGHVFFTGPAAFITVLHAFVDEIILTALLMVGIFAITDQYNTVAPMANLGAVFIGLLFSMIGAAMGYLEGWPLNPARDFGPRLFCYVMGWGPQALPAPGHYWWVPIAGPLIGGVIGGGLYHVLVRPFLAHGVAAAAE
jgi:glycerol uptake facilitator protein